MPSPPAAAEARSVVSLDLLSPAALRALPPRDLPRLADSIREFLIEQVCRTGGHLGANLGVVELTIALHRVFDSPRDMLLFDTGHQAYVHKILTGRAADFGGLRQRDGMSGYRFTDIKISVKHHDPLIMIAAYRELAARCDYPLHLGVTEAGPPPQGTVKSAVAFGVLLHEGIGDTIRVSLTADPVEEVKAGQQILACLGLRERRLDRVVSGLRAAPGRDLYRLTRQVEAAFDGVPHPLRVAVMGCVVNGPGEAREADLGVAGGNGKGRIFVRGEVVKTVPEARIVDTLIEQALKLADEDGSRP